MRIPKLLLNSSTLSGRHRILLVEPEKILADLLIHELATEAIYVAIAMTPSEAHKAIAEVRPDLIILDSEIPEWRELLNDIRSMGKSPPVVVLTRQRPRKNRLDTEEIAGVVDFSEGLTSFLNVIGHYLDFEDSAFDARYQILIVEDDLDLLEMVACALEQSGYQVLKATDGIEALRIIERHPTLSLVLLDLKIPGKGGMEVLKEVRNQHPDIGVVMLTGFRDREIARQAIALGAFDYLVKPIDVIQLESIIMACLIQKEHQRPWWLRWIDRPAS